MRGFERLGDVERDPKRLGERHWTRREPLGERLAFDPLEDERTEIPLLRDAVDARDPGMIERREHARLALQPGEAVRVAGEAIRQQLERDDAPEARVAGADTSPMPPRPASFSTS